MLLQKLYYNIERNIHGKIYMEKYTWRNIHGDLLRVIPFK
jgi:hypothetical protein